MAQGDLIARLQAQGFDKAVGLEDEEGNQLDGAEVICSQCAPLVINGVACHETGCPNIRIECKGCNNLLPKGGRYSARDAYCVECRR